MWQNLASPPENLRYYKFSESPADPQRPNRDVNLQENKTTLFKQHEEQPLPRVPQQSSFSAKEAATTKQPSSSLKNTVYEPYRKNENFPFDLKVRQKHHHGKQPSKSMLDRKQKSSVTLSKKNQSWVIREEPSKVSMSSKNNSNEHAFLQTLQNQEEAESFSEILVQQNSHTEFEGRSGTQFGRFDRNCLKQIMITLREIRDISRERLITQKKRVKLLEEKNQFSLLYQKDGSDSKKPRKSFKKGQEKSFKKGQDKSTIKKLSKSSHLQERMRKVEKSLKVFSKVLSMKVQDDIISKKTHNRTTKKSTSILR